MKNTILIFLIAVSFSSCIKDNKSGLLSQWRLIETDFGFGPTEVESDRIIDFFDDGTISCTGNLCLMRITADEVTTGTYSETDNVIYLQTCDEPEFIISYAIIDSYLYLDYPCFQDCQQKYDQIK